MTQGRKIFFKMLLEGFNVFEIPSYFTSLSSTEDMKLFLAYGHIQPEFSYILQDQVPSFTRSFTPHNVTISFLYIPRHVTGTHVVYMTV